MPKIKTAVIGTGFVGRVHVEAIRRLGEVELAAIADVSEELARKFGEQLGVDRAVGDYRQLLREPDLRAVHVCVPNNMHYPVVKDAINAGKNVLCEKPLAASVAEARELTELAQAKKVVNVTSYNLRFYPL